MSYYRWYAAYGPGLPPVVEEVEEVVSGPSLVEFDGDITQEFGAIIVSGGWVLPAPKVPSAYETVNKLTRSQTDRTFRWQAVVAPPNLPIGLDYKKAFAYRLEITPDLGHQNPDQLFQPYDASQQTGNPRLTTFDFLLPGTDLTGSIDSLTYVVSEDDWTKITNPVFEKYLWRVTALTAEGVPGFPSDFSVFEVQTEVKNSAWTIVDTPEPRGFTQVIAGTKGTEIASIHVLGQAPTVTYPTPTSWRLEVPVQSVSETLFVRAKDQAGNYSSYRSVAIAIEKTSVQDWRLWNTLDEMALMVGLDRFHGETNPDFKTRILDAHAHRGGVRYPSLRNALGRAFGYLDEQEDRALTITRNMRIGGDQDPADVVQITIGPRDFSLFGQQFRATLERQVVDGHSWSIAVDRNLEDIEPLVECPLGHEVDSSLYAVENETNRIRFLSPDFNGKEVWVSYTYRETVPFQGLTLAQLKTVVEAIQIDGVQVLGVAVKAGFESHAAEGLDQLEPTPVMEIEYTDVSGLEVAGIPVRWSPVRIYALQDAEYQESFQNEWGHLFSTAIDSYADQLRALAGQTWGFLVADRGLFVDDEAIQGMAGLPTTLDIPFGFYQSTYDGVKYDYDQFIALAGVDPTDSSVLIQVGVPDTLLKSGVGTQNDLLVTVKPKNTTPLETPTAESPVVQILESSLQDLDETGPTGSGSLDSTNYGG